MNIYYCIQKINMLNELETLNLGVVGSSPTLGATVEYAIFSSGVSKTQKRYNEMKTFIPIIKHTQVNNSITYALVLTYHDSPDYSSFCHPCNLHLSFLSTFDSLAKLQMYRHLLLIDYT